MPDHPRTRPGNPATPAATATRLAKMLLAACALLAVTACSALMPPPDHKQQNPAAPVQHPARPDPAPRASLDIYRLLPFTQQQLTAAATLAGRFTELYGTYSYDQPPAAYLGQLAPITAPALQAALTQGFTAPAIIRQRAADKEIATTTAAVTAVRDIGGTSITFLVTARRHTTAAGVTSQLAQDYAVTVTLNTGTWTVYDIELAAAGQAGAIP